MYNKRLVNKFKKKLNMRHVIKQFLTYFKILVRTC